jgi:hypothetical protein
MENRSGIISNRMKRMIIGYLLVLLMSGCGTNPVKNDSYNNNWDIKPAVKEKIKISGICYVPAGGEGLASVTANSLAENEVLKIESSDRSKATVAPEFLTGSGTITITGVNSSDKEWDVSIMVKRNEKTAAEEAFTIFGAEITKILPEFCLVGGDEITQEDYIFFYEVKPHDCKPDNNAILILSGDKVLYMLKPESGNNPGIYYATLPKGSKMNGGTYSAQISLSLPDLVHESK